MALKTKPDLYKFYIIVLNQNALSPRWVMVVYASRLTCRPEAFLWSVFVLAVSKFWSTACVFLELLGISSLLCLFVLAFLLILPALRFCSFRVQNSRFCCFFSAFYAGRAVSTAFSRDIRRFVVAVSVLLQSIRRADLTAFLRGFRRFCCGDCIFTGYSSLAVSVFSPSIHVSTMITSRSDSIDSQKKQGFANPLTWDWAWRMLFSGATTCASRVPLKRRCLVRCGASVCVCVCNRTGVRAQRENTVLLPLLLAFLRCGEVLEKLR